MAAVFGLRPREVGRVVIFEAGDEAVAAVVPSDGEPDPVLLAKAVRRPSVNKADLERASTLTEFLAETIPPAGLPEDITVVLDESLNRDDVLYFPGGEPRAVLKIRGTDLARATEAKVDEILFRWPGE
jgi:Cys-tRNA(Pro)/Cys-tRNA(Cys) deacylase